MSSPRLLLLDEPTSGTSPSDRVMLSDILSTTRDEGTSTVIVDHDVEFVSRHCDQVLAMSFGRELAAGAPGQVLQNPVVQEAFLGPGHVARTASPSNRDDD
jgi:branched-chain amino acid transport system ATP-binding protein